MEYFLLKPKRETDFKAKYKTEICRNWTQGLCEFGDKCTFAHGYHELRIKDYLTVNYRTKKCKQFHEQGFCQYGSRCQFIHREHSSEPFIPDLRKKDHSPETASSSPRTMENYAKETTRRLPIFIKLTEEIN
ncbi:hypothetical protein SteCoe_6404 [Stentor coeruleus]|uniref:C3H1-type domain-containing protein n=1 Tax=Stentor coeruleus TaxID=5963 RepID=A0A1R2CQ95_9CILI|nr:hypothetical protein SteCoe_6404 [Stentor coeruleus]